MREILERLFEQQTLQRDEAKSILLRAVQNEFTPAQLASFLTVFRMRPMAVPELAGFRDALLERAIKIDLKEFEPVDLCGTGGDSKSSFNISTLAALVVAACGVRVAKHGNYAVSSLCGSSNVLEELGIRFTSDESILKKQLEKSGICFFHAPLFHPSMKIVAPVRKEMGVKTFFNLLGPLVNPASPDVQLTGVYNLEIMRLYSYLAQSINKYLTIVHSLDGYDEVSLTARFKVVSPSGEATYEPAEIGFTRLSPNDIKAGSGVKESAKIFSDILNGKGSAAQNSVVTVNAAFALQAVYEKRGKSRGLRDCIEEATTALSTGAAKRVMEKHLELQP